LSHDNETRNAYFDKLEALKNILEEEFITDLVFERDYVLENGKTISRIWVEKLGVSVSNRQYWDEIFTFITKNEC
jgi:hypothetical protein